MNKKLYPPKLAKAPASDKQTHPLGTKVILNGGRSGTIAGFTQIYTSWAIHLDEKPTIEYIVELERSEWLAGPENLAVNFICVHPDSIVLA